MSERPLHRPLHPIEDHPEVFQHPIRGHVLRLSDQLRCRANDIDKDGSEDDLTIYVGVEVFRARNELGAWLTERHPYESDKLRNHLFVEAVFPCDFEGDNEDARAVLSRVDLAQSVIDAGGGCTICGAQNDDDSIDHAVGCEYMSWVMFTLAKRIVDAAGDPSMADVISAAHDQIMRME